MNYFLKSATLIVFLLVSLGTKAQDLVRKIPVNALAVVTVKGDNLTELMSVSEFNNTFFGKKIQEKLAKSGNNSINGIDDLGFNLSSSFYYYNQTNDSVTYHCFLAPLKNASQLDALYSQSDKKFSTAGKVRTYCNEDSTEVALWNENMLLFVKGDAKNTYFLKSDVRKRLGLSAQADVSLTDTTAAGTDYAVATDSSAVTVVADDAAVMATVPDDDLNAQQPVVKKAKSSKYKTGKAKSRKHTISKKHKRKPLKKKVVKEEKELEEPAEEVAMADSTSAFQ